VWQLDGSEVLTVRSLIARTGQVERFRNVSSIRLSSFEGDGVVVIIRVRIIAIWLTDGHDLINQLFVRLIAEERYQLVMYLVEGLGRMIPFEAPLYQQIRRGDFFEAMKVLENFPVDVKRPFAWIIGEGADRFALHVILQFGKFKDVIELIQRRILVKYEIFPPLAL
jgi:hypothetical protein